MSRVTIGDVAKIANVSITTVSRVINNSCIVKEETRQRVEKAVEALGFQPNLLAKSLIANESKTIGVLTPSIENLFFSEVISGISDVFEELGYTLLLSCNGGDYKKEKKDIKNFLGRMVDGIIMLDARKNNSKNGFFGKTSKRIPMVLVNGFIEEKKCNMILNNVEKPLVEIIQNFVQRGKKKIALLKGENSYSYEYKEIIYSRTMRSLDMREYIISVSEGNDLKTIYKTEKKIEKFLLENNRPDVIIACNDLMAIGALNVLNKMKINVPREISVVGYDNSIFSEILNISSVDQNMNELGKKAAKRLLDIINGDKRITRTYVDTKLVERET